MSEMFDVVAVNIKTNKVLWVQGPQDAENSDAVIRMAIMRQGVDDRFFSPCEVGRYKSGDDWNGGVQLGKRDPEYLISNGVTYPRGKRGL